MFLFVCNPDYQETRVCSGFAKRPKKIVEWAGLLETAIVLWMYGLVKSSMILSILLMRAMVDVMKRYECEHWDDQHFIFWALTQLNHKMKSKSVVRLVEIGWTLVKPKAFDWKWCRNEMGSWIRMKLRDSEWIGESGLMDWKVWKECG